MQNNRMADKRIVQVDGEEWGDIIGVGDDTSEKGSVEVGDGQNMRTITNGQKSISPRDLSLAISRNSSFKQQVEDWYENNEVHDVTIISVDGHGVEFERELLTECEIQKKTRPAYEVTSATEAKLDFTIVPFDSVIQNS